MKCMGVIGLIACALTACKSAPPPPSANDAASETPSSPATDAQPATATSAATSLPADPNAVGDTGFIVDLPPGCKIIKASTEGFWDVRCNGRQTALLMTSPVRAKSLEDLKSSHCGKRKVLKSAKLPSGTLFVACESQVEAFGKKVATTSVFSEATTKAGTNISCQQEADDAELIKVAEQVCRGVHPR